jgi:hypothetical protein
MQIERSMHLLRQVWGSPLLGDSFQPDAARPRTVLSQIEVIHPAFVNSLEAILVQGMPLVSPAEVGRLTRQIVPNTLAFCLGIAAGEIADTERLRAVVVNIALIYWADQSMDAGDEGMERAVRLLNEELEAKRPVTTAGLPTLVEARLTALRWIEREVENFCRPEDAPLLKRYAIQETLQNEARMRELTRCYGLEGGPAFWAAQAQEIVRLSLVTIVLTYVVAVIYAVYRQHQPQLPTLSEIFEQKPMMDLLHGPFNATLRLFDDLGDRLVDKKRFPGWGEFNLNIFNQPDPGLVRAFLRQADLIDEAVTQSVFDAFQANTEASRAYILQVFVDLVRDRFTALPMSIKNQYAVFLNVAKRTLEAGSVYLIADKGLTMPST